MTVQTKAVLKTYFVKGAKPTAQNFADLIDSYQDTGSSSSFTPIGQALVNASTQASALSALGIAFVTTAQAQTAGAATGYMNPVLTRAAIESKAPAIATAVISSAYATTAQAVSGLATTGLMSPVLVRNAIENFAPSSSGGLVPIKTVTASAVSSVDFVNGTGGVVLDGTYKDYVIVFYDVVPATDGSLFLLRSSTDAGSTYDSGANDYNYAAVSINPTGGTTAGDTANGSTSIPLSYTGGVGNASTESIAGMVTIHNPSGSIKHKLIQYQTACLDPTTVICEYRGSGSRRSASDIDAIRFLFSAGNISSGTFTLYGVSQ